MINFKKTLALMFGLAICLCQGAKADGEWTPKIVDGRTWTIMEQYWNGTENPKTVYRTIKVDGTEVVEGFSCWRFFHNSSGPFYMREDSGRLLVLVDKGQWDVMYDFSLDVEYWEPREGHYITCVDTVYVGGVPCRRLAFDHSAHSGIYWVEGIGGTDQGPIFQSEYLGNLIGSWVVSVYDGDVCVYDMAKGFTTSSVDATPAGRDGDDETVYDLQGRRISGKPSQGIYIVNGRKYAVGR